MCGGAIHGSCICAVFFFIYVHKCDDQIPFMWSKFTIIDPIELIIKGALHQISPPLENMQILGFMTAILYH